MTTVHLDLEDGFVDDAVEVWAAGARLAHLDGVRTRPQIGLAEQVSVDVPDGVTLTVRRGPDHLDLPVDPAQPHLGLSVVDGQLVARRSADPFPRA